jgi:hypothetical protein
VPGVDDVFTALSDPTRREVLRSLSERPELTASRLADAMDWMAQVGASWDRRLARLAERARG